MSNLTRIRLRQARGHMQSGNMLKAAELLEQVRVLARGDSNILGPVLQDLAHVYTVLGTPGKAEQCTTELLALIPGASATLDPVAPLVARRRRYTWILLGILLVALLISGGVALWRYTSPGPAATPTVRSQVQTGAGGETSMSFTGGEAAALANIIADYAKRLKAAHNSPLTDIQRQEAVAAAVEELKARVETCGTIAFAGTVAEIIPEGAKYAGDFRWETRNRWGISMSLPQDFEALVRDGVCTFGSKVWINLEKKDALLIQKGDPITIRGPVSYKEGGVLFPSDCVDIQVWPNTDQSVVKGLGLGNLGSPQTIAMPVSGGVSCSVGRFGSLPVHTYFGE